MRTAGDGIISNCVYAFAMQQKEEAHRVTSCGRSLMYATAASKFLIFLPIPQIRLCLGAILTYIILTKDMIAIEQR